MDISQLSDAELLGALGQKTPKADLSAMSDADLLKAIGNAPGPTENVNTIADVAKSGGIGLARGAIGLAGLPGDLADLASRGYDFLTGSNTNASVAPYAQAIGSQNIQKKIEGYTGEFYKPKTTAGEYAQTAGEFAPAIIGGPETLATKVATRVALPAAVSESAGQLTHGTSLEPYARITGAVLGAGIPAAIGRTISPVVIPQANAEAVNTLKNAGVTGLTAGQQSGSRVLKYAESELGDALGAGGKATAANERVLEQFTSAAAKKAGIDAQRVTPEVLDNAFTNNSAKFDSAIQSAGDIPIPDFAAKGEKIITDFKDLTGTDSTLLQKFVDRIAGKSELPTLPQNVSHISKEDYKKLTVPVRGNSTISGESYQAIQSEIGAMARRAPNPELKLALYDLKGALDSSVSNGLKDPKVAEAFRNARQEYKNLLVIEKASGKSADGLITPSALHQAAQSVSKRYFNRGKDDFSSLAKAGKSVLAPLPQSGTAPRAAMHFIPSLVGGVAGAGIGAIPGALAGAFAPAMAGRVLMSRPVQAYLSNQKVAALRRIPTGKNMLRGGVLGAISGS